MKVMSTTTTNDTTTMIKLEQAKTTIIHSLVFSMLCYDDNGCGLGHHHNFASASYSE